MALLCEVYAVIGQGDAPLSGVDKADVHSFRKGLTEPGKGAGILNELPTGHPCSQTNRRLLNMIISEETIENLEEDGLRGPIRKEKRDRDVEYSSRVYQNAPTYYAYAKDLCENYRFDLDKYRFCVNENRYAAISREDFAKLREDLIFLHKALKTVLGDYKDYFRERFAQGLSIRKYAQAHQINRGSVDHQQKKFFSALAQLLKERDEAEGKCRLRPQNN